MDNGALESPESQRLAEEQAGVNVEREDHNSDGDDEGLAMMTDQTTNKKCLSPPARMSSKPER